MTHSCTPKMSVIVEWKKWHIFECVRAMMFEINVKKVFWPDAYRYAVTLINTMPTTTIKYVILYELFF